MYADRPHHAVFPEGITHTESIFEIAGHLSLVCSCRTHFAFRSLVRALATLTVMLVADGGRCLLLIGQ
jgi:phage terminase large subunit-like protein